jgi:hypothetical protein
MNYCTSGGFARMPKRRKPKTFRAVEAVKALARERIGAPPAAQVIPNRKKNIKQKHKKSLNDLQSES